MKKFLLVFGLIVLITPFIAWAQAGDTATMIICRVLNVARQIVAAVGFGIVVILIIIGGIRYMTAGGDESKTADARKGIQNALIGLVIVVSAMFLIGLAQSLVQQVSIGALFNPLSNPCIVYDIEVEW